MAKTWESYVKGGKVGQWKINESTEFQMTIMQMISWGYEHKAIAKKMEIRESYIESTTKRLRILFEARNTLHLVAILIRKKLIL